MNNFSKTYRTDKYNITIRINRDELYSAGCRITIKEKKDFGCLRRILYDWFWNDKDMFKKFEIRMIQCKVPRTTIDEIITDININLKFEKVVLYQPIPNKMFWE